MVLLSELIKTRFITSNLVGDLTNVLDECVQRHEEVDLSYCRFSSICEGKLRTYYGKLRLCNIKEPELDKVLQHNSKVADYKEIKEFVNVPIINSKKALLQLFREIDKSKIYQFTNYNLSPVRYKVVAILMLLKFYDVEIDLENHLADIFKQVRLDWLKNRKSHICYTEVVGNAILTRDVVDGCVQVPGVGYVTEDIYVKSYNCLPYEFGTQLLYGNEEFKDVWDNALRVFEQTLTMNEERSMRKYIEVR